MNFDWALGLRIEAREKRDSLIIFKFSSLPQASFHEKQAGIKEIHNIGFRSFFLFPHIHPESSARVCVEISYDNKPRRELNAPQNRFSMNNRRLDAFRSILKIGKKV